MSDLGLELIYAVAVKRLQGDAWVVYESGLVDLVCASPNPMRSNPWLTKRTLLLDVERWRELEQPDRSSIGLSKLLDFA